MNRDWNAPDDAVVHMLLRDIGLQVMPVGSRYTGRDFAARIEPVDPAVTRVIVHGLNGASRTQSDRDDLADSACDFIKHCARGMLGRGRVVFEWLECPPSERRQGRTRTEDYGGQWFRLVDRPARWRGHQWVYPARTGTWDDRRQETRTIATSKVVVFRQSRRVRRRTRVMMDRLSMLGAASLPGVDLLSDGAMEQIRRVDVPAFTRSQGVSKARATRHIGWDARGAFREHITEYYWLHRRLVFEEMLLSLRETILASLNTALVRIGKELGFTAQLRLSGLPGPGDIEDARSKLRSGSASLHDVLAPFLDNDRRQQRT